MLPDLQRTEAFMLKLDKGLSGNAVKQISVVGVSRKISDSGFSRNALATSRLRSKPGTSRLLALVFRSSHCDRNVLA